MQSDFTDLEISLRSRLPIIVIESHEEARVIDLLKKLAKQNSLPLYQWTVTDGISQIDIEFGPKEKLNNPTEALEHIRNSMNQAYFVLLDFHPYLENPFHIRLIKEIAQNYSLKQKTLVFLSHKLNLPPELKTLSGLFELSIPAPETVREIVTEVAREWATENQSRRVVADKAVLDKLIQNLIGLTASDVRRFARTAIYDDGMITQTDIDGAMRAKYELLDETGVLSIELNTAQFSQVAGLESLKKWLDMRRAIFTPGAEFPKLDPPKGILLLGIQGCGKSLAAKAVAGTWGIPLLRFDFGGVYDKFIGETEKRLKQSLKGAELMAPCVLWLDEIEKGISTGDTDGGTSRRVLGMLLTWMAEKKTPVFLVATANDIEALPPELIRKGRFDEIFFVDLPDEQSRAEILKIHLAKRDLNPEMFELPALTSASVGFSGAELEQAVVATLYASHAQRLAPSTKLLLEELNRTKPLSTIMSEKIESLRSWAKDRTVPAA